MGKKQISSPLEMNPPEKMCTTKLPLLLQKLYRVYYKVLIDISITFTGQK